MVESLKWREIVSVLVMKIEREIDTGMELIREKERKLRKTGARQNEHYGIDAARDSSDTHYLYSGIVRSAVVVSGGEALVWRDLERLGVRAQGINMPGNIYKVSRIWSGTRRWGRGVARTSLLAHGTN